MQSRKWIFILSITTLYLLGIYDIILLCRYATDVPFWDIWDLTPNGNYHHLFDFYNQNMQFFYFVISETLYYLVNWNLKYFVFVNFVIYLSLIYLYYLILKSANVKKIECYPLYLCVLLSPMLGFNWLWVFLVQTHTYILFFLLAIYFGFIKDDKTCSPYIYAICLFLSVISMNVPLAIGGIIAYIIKECVNINKTEIRRTVRKIIIVIAVESILLLLLNQLTDIAKFFVSKQTVLNLNQTILTTENFYNLSFYLMNVMGVFVFASILNAKICAFLLPIHLGIMCIVFFEQYRIKKMQALWGIIFTIIFCICCIVAFRGGEVYSYNFSFIRHNETAFILIPATLLVLASSKYKWIRIYGILLLFFMLIGIGADIKAKRFQFFGELFYKNGCVCLNHYHNLKTITGWQCTMNAPIPRDDVMLKGAQMKFSFIKSIKGCY